MKKNIAIIGMSFKLPGANNSDQFWINLCEGRDCVTRYSEDEIIRKFSECDCLGDPNFIRAYGVIDKVYSFDRKFFNMTESDAEVLDPQQRLLIECSWKAIEDAGYNVDELKERVGVYAGVSKNLYLNYLLTQTDVVDNRGMLSVLSLNEKDYVASRISYLFDFNGPSVNVQSACSTSLSALYLACQGIIQGECDIALAASACVANGFGYTYQQGGILSKSGTCRPFSQDADGCVPADGVTALVLKEFEKAQRDGDDIYAVIRGCSMNNDGGNKMSFAAPNNKTQADVIKQALLSSGITADLIDYIEMHGTGTYLGDLVEFEAVKGAYNKRQINNICEIGSVKGNIGHADVSSGMAGIIKVILMMQYKKIVPSINLITTNKQLNMNDSCFSIATLHDWKEKTKKRYAQVNSFGIGGTNCVIVLEDYHRKKQKTQIASNNMFLFSARTSKSLKSNVNNFLRFIKKNNQYKKEDIICTLAFGRKQFEHRCILLADTLEDLQNENYLVVENHVTESNMIFMFTGVGNNYYKCCNSLYQKDEFFKTLLDVCIEKVQQKVGIDLRCSLGIEQEKKHRREENHHLCIFVIEYCLAKYLMAYGVTPSLFIGYSMGEYTAFCMADAISFEDVVYIIAEREKLFLKIENTDMLAVGCHFDEISKYLFGDIEVAVHGGNNFTVVGGTVAQLEKMAAKLEVDGISFKWMNTGCAYHTSHLKKYAKEFESIWGGVTVEKNKIPVLSCTLQKLIKSDILDIEYWCKHLFSTVYFYEQISFLAQNPANVFLEIGPDQFLKSIVNQSITSLKCTNKVLSVFGHERGNRDNARHFQQILSELWCMGIKLDFKKILGNKKYSKAHLPTYTFEDDCFKYNELPKVKNDDVKNAEREIFYYEEKWVKRECLTDVSKAVKEELCLLFSNNDPLSEKVMQYMKRYGYMVEAVNSNGDEMWIENIFCNKISEESFIKLFEACSKIPQKIIYLWGINQGKNKEKLSLDNFFYIIFYLIRAIGKRYGDIPIDIHLVSNYHIHDDKEYQGTPEGKMIECFPKVVNNEFEHIRCYSINLSYVDSQYICAKRIVESCCAKDLERHIMIQGNNICIKRYKELKYMSYYPKLRELEEEEVYIVVGGFGGLGQVICRYLITKKNSNVLLIGKKSKENIEKLKKLESEFENYRKKLNICFASVLEPEKLMKIVSDIVSNGKKVVGVFYVVGIQKFGMIQNRNITESKEVIMSKSQGLINVLDALKNTTFDFFVSFSSITGIIGGIGNLDFTAANLFMDAYCEYYKLMYRKNVISIAWDSWSEVGAAQNAIFPKEYMDNWKKSNENAITPTEGIEILETIVNSQLNNVIVSVFDINERLQAVYNRSIRDIVQAGYGGRDKNKLDQPIEDKRIVEEVVEEAIRAILGNNCFDESDNFFDMGGNSLSVIQVASNLQKKYPQVHITPAVFYEKTNVRDLIKYIEDSINNEVKGKQTKQAKYQLDEKHEIVNDIAVVAMTGRFPGAKGIEEFWENLCDGKESIFKVSKSEIVNELISEQILDDENYILYKPYIEGIEDFDASLFGINPREAEMLNPNYRILLEMAFECLSQSGYLYSKQKIGLYAGSNQNDYEYRMLLNDKYDNFLVNCYNSRDCLPAYISYILNLTGPSVNVQSSCSTSMVALHMAIKAILNNECDMCLAGGVNIILPNKCGYYYNEDGIYPPDGKVKTFSDDANGMIFGDGGGMVLLKKLSEAQKDKDHILAIIKGSAVNNSGNERANFLAPGIKSECEVVKSALRAANVKPESISYIETHGTGTPIGDEIEIRALKTVFDSLDRERYSCALGSIKPNIGHADAAAGIIGVIKVLLMLQKRLFVPNININKLNPNLELDGSVFYVPQKLELWHNDNYPLRAGVSAFGIGGTNSHMILEEYRHVQKSISNEIDFEVIPISGLDFQRTTSLLIYLRDWLMKQQQVRICDIAYTFQRKSFFYKYRECFVVKSVSEFIRKINERLESGRTVEKKDTVGYVIYTKDVLLLDGKSEKGFLNIQLPEEGMIKKYFDFYNKYTHRYATKISDCANRHLCFLFAIIKSLMQFNITPNLILGDDIGILIGLFMTNVLNVEMFYVILVLFYKKDYEIAQKKISTVFSNDFEDSRMLYCYGTKSVFWRDFEAQYKNIVSANALHREDILYIDISDLLQTEKALFQYKFYDNVSKAWCAGIAVKWEIFHSGRDVHNILIDGYPYQRKRYWVDNNITQFKTLCKPLEREARKDKENNNKKSNDDIQSLLKQINVEIICIWKDVFGIEDIDNSSDFFELGGNSLLLLQLTIKYKRRFNVTIRLKDIVESSKVCQHSEIVLSNMIDTFK